MEHNSTNNFLLLCVVFNTLLLATDGVVDEKYETIINTLNDIFTFLFLIESVLKKFAFGFVGYFSKPINVFDFIIAYLSLIDFIINQSSDT